MDCLRRMKVSQRFVQQFFFAISQEGQGGWIGVDDAMGL